MRKDSKKSRSPGLKNTERLRAFLRQSNVDIMGIADMKRVKGLTLGIPLDVEHFISKFPFAIVLGAQLGKLGKRAKGDEVALFLEKAALDLWDYLDQEGYHALTIHTDDEFDPGRRLGLMSLKVLAKTAGLGWQGRSLLIVSPEYGPLHRLIAVLTDMPLIPDEPIPSQCGDCSLCVDYCPPKSLTLVRFEDRPQSREQVLDIRTCRGDEACLVCLQVCPWARRHKASS
jgi:epoxyqueuosine reductase